MACSLSRMTSAAPTTAQFEALLDFLEEHRDLARGMLRNVEGRARSHQLWENICTTLNSMGGCMKTTKQWQKVWIDKSILLKRAAAARRSASVTGGGPSTAPQLSHWEIRVVSIMGDGFGGPQTTARVAAFPEQSQESISAVETPVSPHLEGIRDLPPVFDQHLHFSTDAGQPSRVSPPHGDTLQNRTSRTHQSRERRRLPSRLLADQRSIRERLFSLEQSRIELDRQRNEELRAIKQEVAGIKQEVAGIKQEVAGIKEIMTELCGLIQKFTEKITTN